MKNLENIFDYKKKVIVCLSPNADKYITKESVFEENDGEKREYYYINKDSIKEKVNIAFAKTIKFLDNETILFLNDEGIFSLKNDKTLVLNGDFDDFEIINSSKIILWKNHSSKEETLTKEGINVTSQSCEISIYDTFSTDKSFYKINEGNIYSCSVFKSEIYFLVKSNHLFDFPEQLWKLESEKLDIVNKNLFSFIDIIGKIENQIIFVGYSNFPSNSSMEKKILIYNEEKHIVEEIDLLLRGTLLEVNLVGENILVRESDNFDSLIYIIDYRKKEILKKVKIPKFIRNIKIFNNNIWFLEEDFFTLPQIKIMNIEEFFCHLFIGNDKQFQEIKIITWEYQNLKIEGALLVPKENITKNLVVITTGRSNQFVRCHFNSVDLTGGTDNFPYPIQDMLTRGYSVFLCNCRSNTFHEFENRNNFGYKRLAGYSEIVEKGIEKVEENFKFENIFIVAWSLGAYVAANLAFTSKNKYNLILGNGIYNLISMYETSNVFEFMEFMGGDVLKNGLLQNYIEASPFFKSKNFKGKILLQHISKDEVMPVSQSKQLYYQLIFSNKQVNLIIYKDKGHNFTKGSTLLQASRDVLNFLEQNKQTNEEK